MNTLILIAATCGATQPDLILDPDLIVQAGEVWSVIGRPDNPIWPKWNAKDTPILIYFPNRQELLINHPKPPSDFQSFVWAGKSNLGKMAIRNGTTTFEFDGQNTSTEINGIGTLVIADTLSTRRQWVEGLVPPLNADPNNTTKIIEDSLFGNPYDSMAMFAHEAFHVFQDRLGKDKPISERALRQYPALSAENNAGVAIEGRLLAQALRAIDEKSVRDFAKKVAAIREWRRKQVDPSVAEYEDGIEYLEGTAKYIEYRLFEFLEGKKPSPEMWLVQGFRGYHGLNQERERLVSDMKAFLSGDRVVNNDPYGASGVRFRQYYSGMAMGALLDRLNVDWKSKIFAPTESLSQLLLKTLKTNSQELESIAREVIQSKEFQEELLRKKEFAVKGEQFVQGEVAKFDSALGEVRIDFSNLEKPRVGLAYTPFGILNISPTETMYRMVPARGLVNDFKFSEDSARPVIEDRKCKTYRLLLTAPPPASLTSGPINSEKLQLPGVMLEKVKGDLLIEGKRVTVILRP